MYFIAYGILIGVISFLLLYVLGMLSLPKNFVSTPFFPTFVGVAVVSLIFWYGIQCSYSLHTIFKFILFITITLCFIRIKYISNILKNISVIITWKTFWKRFFFWFGAYILFYVLAYIFLPLPDSKEYLPLTRINNFDIFNYVNVTQYLLSSSMRYNFWTYYYQTPAVYYFYAWMSLFYHDNAMMVAMPILYSTVSAIGLMIVFYCYHLFRCPRKISVAIAAVILCGSFYRYIIGVYFLSSLMGTIVWLAFLIEILQWDFVTSPSEAIKPSQHGKSFWRYFVVIFIYECLLLLIYPVFFIFIPLVFPVAIGIMLLLSTNCINASSWYVFFKKEIFFVVRLLLPMIFLYILMPGYFEKVEHNLFEFAHRIGVIGFPLLSSAALLGFPYYFEQIPQNYIPITLAFLLFLAGLLYALHAARLNLQPAAYTLLYLVIGAFIGYYIYYAIEGSTRYQPWKFASYFILPLTGVFWALAFRLKTSEKGFIGVIIFCILGNFLWIKFPPLDPLKKDYQKLLVLNTLPGNDLYINMSTDESTFISVFFIRNKNLHLLSPSCYYYPQVLVKDVPNSANIFVESKLCEPKGIKIPSLGCLYSSHLNLRLH